MYKKATQEQCSWKVLERLVTLFGLVKLWFKEKTLKEEWTDTNNFDDNYNLVQWHNYYISFFQLST